MSLLEILGVATGLLCVWLTVRENIWCWPAGIVNAALFLAMFGLERLYADAGLQVVYIVLSVYGWYRWLHPGEDREELPVTRIAPREALVLGAICTATAATMGGLLHAYTDASLPFWDSTTVAMSLVAQYLLARKVLESWVVWVAADVIMVGIYLAKALYLTSALYVVFTVLAVAGYRAWKGSYSECLARA